MKDSQPDWQALLTVEGSVHINLITNQGPVEPISIIYGENV